MHFHVLDAVSLSDDQFVRPVVGLLSDFAAKVLRASLKVPHHTSRIGSRQSIQQRLAARTCTES